MVARSKEELCANIKVPFSLGLRWTGVFQLKCSFFSLYPGCGLMLRPLRYAG